MKGLFWQPEDSTASTPASGADPSQEISDEEFASLLAASPHAVPPDSAAPVEAQAIEVRASGDEILIDFQSQYDLAGIPDTDEVEQLENFLNRLDPSLPQVSKIAAAQAFLGAIGKDTSAVLADAQRKIARVRGILKSKEDETKGRLDSEQAEILALEAKIEEHRGRMQDLNRHLEGVRRACLVEESRLQAARVFFGTTEAQGVPSPTASARR